MTHSSPWKIPTINGGVVRWENHQFLWAMASMAMLNNQRVYIYILVVKPLCRGGS